MTNNQFKLVPVDYTKPYDQQPDCKRHVIGAYANLARHNMMVTINTILQAIGMELKEENHIEVVFNKPHRKELGSLDNIQKINLQKRLYRHFPFLKRLKLEDESKKSVQLDKLLEVMSDFTNCMAVLRNYYTHYLPYNSHNALEEQLKLKKKMGRLLQYLYENTSQFLKSNEKLDHESNEVLSALRIPEDYVEVIGPTHSDYERTKKFYFNDKIDKKKKRGLNYNPNTEVFEKKSVRFVRNPDYPANMTDNERGMSDVAVLYFLCLFLEKKDSFRLMDEVGFTNQVKFKGKDANQQLLYVKEIMCMNRIRVTKAKLDSEMSDTALALDMINELRKCPKPLYEVLGKEAREEFKDDATVIWERENGQEAVSTEDTIDSDNDLNGDNESVKSTPRSTFVRWNDRFPQFALSYIDMTSMFNDIRFQLNLGKYRFAFYTHTSEQSVDGQERLRILQKELHGFGRPAEVSEEMNEKWKPLFVETTVEDGVTKREPDKDGQAPYVTNQRPQYAIDEKSHSIALRWDGWNNEGRKTIKDKDGNAQKEPHYGDLDNKKMFIPYIPLNPTKGEGQTNQSESLLPPQCTINLFELPALLFYQYLMTKHKNSRFDAETIIKDTYNRQILFFNDVAKGSLTPLDGPSIDDAEKEKQLWEQRKKELNKQLEKYKLTVSDIPTKLRDYLCKKDVDIYQKLADSAKKRLEEKKARVERAKSSYDQKKKVIGTKGNKFDKMHASIKTGSLAQWLIRDITDWLPENSLCRTTLTGQKYIAIQSALTFLGQQFIDTDKMAVDITKLESIFRNAGFIPKTNESDNDGHPFLPDVLNKCKKESVEGFFETYLQCELEHIQKMMDLIDTGEDYEDYLQIPFLHYNRKRWKEQNADSIRNLALRYLERPLQLPNGLFTKPVLDLLMELENDNLHKALHDAQSGGDDGQLSNNMAYLVRLYFENVENDQPQPFYNTAEVDGSTSHYLHIYRIFKKLYGKKIDKTNRTTTPAYTIDEIRDLRKKASGDIKSFVEDEIQNWKKKQQNDFEKKLREKLKKENDKRYKKHEKLLNVDEEVEKAVRKEDVRIREEIVRMREEKTRKMERLLGKVYDNERDIRRYKTQDMLMLIMAREILKAKNRSQEFTQGFQLKNVMSNTLLDKPIDFTWDVHIKGKDKASVTKTIRQKGMKMKDYGQFYKFASDHQRLESLLSRLPDSDFLRSEIENEFSYYDTNRSEVFRQVYIIESEAYKLSPQLIDDKNDDKEWFYYEDKKGRHPIRNSFKELLRILVAGEDGVLDEKEKEVMRKTRNAFGHNTYDVDFDIVFRGKERKRKIPEIANGIKENIENQTDEIRNKL